MPSLRPCSMCCFAMSASVECVAMRTDAAPAACAASRSSTVPMPGSSSTVIFARVTLVDGGLDPLAIGVRAEPVVEARPRQPVAVADLDGVDARAIERRRDAPHVVDRILVADGVHAVAQRDVLDVERGLPAEAVRRRRVMPSPAAPHAMPPGARPCEAPPTS